MTTPCCAAFCAQPDVAPTRADVVRPDRCACASLVATRCAVGCFGFVVVVAVPVAAAVFGGFVAVLRQSGKKISFIILKGKS